MKKIIVIAVLLIGCLMSGYTCCKTENTEEPITTTTSYEKILENLNLEETVEEVVSTGTVSTKSQTYICEDIDGWVTATSLNIRSKPSKKGKILGELTFGSHVTYTFDSSRPNWLEITLDNGKTAYIAAKYVTDSKPKCKEILLPYNSNYKGFKSWMSYTAITNRSSQQYKLQQMCKTGKYGIRVVKGTGRYCVAIGEYFNCDIGQVIDLVLEDETIIPCVVGDIKATEHTTSDDVYTNVTHNLCASEFIVDKYAISDDVYNQGTLSCIKGFEDKVIAIRVYKTNVLEED